MSTSVATPSTAPASPAPAPASPAPASPAKASRGVAKRRRGAISLGGFLRKELGGTRVSTAAADAFTSVLVDGVLEPLVTRASELAYTASSGRKTLQLDDVRAAIRLSFDAESAAAIIAAGNAAIAAYAASRPKKADVVAA